ncbi:MAG: glycosyltransferase family 4 protein, partial [bacterium]|nr:glycosyltransferase family 4 protein [bacterium]
MRILYHHRTQAEDAQGIHINELIKAWRKLGHEVEVVALAQGGEDLKKTKGKIWGYIASFSPRMIYELLELAYNLVGYIRLVKAGKRFRPNFIYERYSLYNFSGILAARSLGIPLILEVNAPIAYEKKEYERLVFSRLARYLEKSISSRADKTIVVSGALRDHLLQTGVTSDKIVVLPNGVNLEEFDSSSCNGEAVRRKYGLDGKIVLGFTGWFRDWHGLNLALEMINEIGDNRCHLLLVGDGPARPDLEAYVHAHALESSVTFTGPVERKNIPAYVAAFDIALQPGVTPYASPMKLIEYMALGKAIVAPELPNICEIIKDEQNGLLFRKGNRDDLKRALLKLIEHPEFRGQLGEAARQTILERNLTWEGNAQRVIGLVRSQKSEVRSPLCPLWRPFSKWDLIKKGVMEFWV